MGAKVFERRLLGTVRKCGLSGTTNAEGSVSGAGKVRFGRVWEDMQERNKVIRWRGLRSRVNGSFIWVFGYSAYPQGPWFGFADVMLPDAPCVHCGRKGVFSNIKAWAHECPAVWDRVRLPCQDPHPCKGEPSMAVAPMWKSTDWFETSSLRDL